jgi:hypothetical protein
VTVSFYVQFRLGISDVLCAEVGTKSVIAITPCYVFTLSLNALTLRRKVFASYSYRSRLIEIVIASYNYRFGTIGIVIAAYSYRSIER